MKESDERLRLLRQIKTDDDSKLEKVRQLHEEFESQKRKKQ